MAEPISHSCGCPLGFVNGRSLRSHLSETGATIGRSFGLTEWVPVCPVCDRTMLHSEVCELPFRGSDGVMRVTGDYSDEGKLIRQESLSFAAFAFSSGAFDASLSIFRRSDQTTKNVELQGAELLSDQRPELALEFSKEVCKWGRGQRVWGNLLRHHDRQDLAELLCFWLGQVRNLTAREAIQAGIEVKGLNVSFASKHLRMVDPSRFGVLDAVLEEGLGIATNPVGYSWFIDLLNEFQQAYRPMLSVSDIEAAVFGLVRQTVRAVGSRGKVTNIS